MSGPRFQSELGLEVCFILERNLSPLMISEFDERVIQSCDFMNRRPWKGIVYAQIFVCLKRTSSTICLFLFSGLYACLKKILMPIKDQWGISIIFMSAKLSTSQGKNFSGVKLLCHLMSVLYCLEQN